MSKKLLSEAVMRRFAKLANLEPVNEMYGGGKGDLPRSAKKDYMQEDAMSDIEDEVDSALPPGEEVEMAPGEEEISDEPAMDMDAGADNEGLASDVLSAVATALEDALGVAIEIDGGEEEAEMDMDAGEAEMDMDAGEEEMEMADDEEMDMVAESLKGISYVPGKKQIVNEVAKRVAARLLKAKKAESQLKKALGRQSKS